MIDQVERPRPGQGLRQAGRVRYLDVGMISMRAERDTAAQEMNRIGIGLDGSDGRTIVDGIEPALPCRLEAPAIGGLCKIERRDAGLRMVGNKNAVKGDVVVPVLCMHHAGTCQNERDARRAA